jgi:hypothetical protein
MHNETIQRLPEDTSKMFSSPIAEAIFSVVCWVVGFMAVFKTAWAVTHALALQRRFPNAFSSRLAERSWYPIFLKVGGVLCLFFALICSLEVGLWVLAGQTINPNWK